MLLCAARVPACPAFAQAILLNHRHRFRNALIPSLQFIEIHSRTHVLRFPFHLRFPRWLFHVQKRLHFAAKDIVNIQRHCPGNRNRVANRSRWVKRVWVVGVKGIGIGQISIVVNTVRIAPDWPDGTGCCCQIYMAGVSWIDNRNATFMWSR